VKADLEKLDADVTKAKQNEPVKSFKKAFMNE